MPIVNQNVDKNDLSKGPVIRLVGRFFEKSNVVAHKHDFTEIILVTQGNCHVQIGTKTLYGKPGDLFIIPPDVPHIQIEEELVGTSYIGFHHLPEIFDTSFRMISLQNEIFLIRWIEDIIDLHTFIFSSKPYVEVVCGLLNAVISRIKQIEQHLKGNVLTHPKLQKAMDIINRDITQHISVEQIASEVDLSESHLTALFIKHNGCGLIKYQQKQRMRLACRYLLDPYVTVSQAAKQCGYEDVNFFIRVFRKNHNLSPGKWRKQFSTLND